MTRVALLALCLLTRAALAAPVSVIYDSDIGPDCDDVGALAVLHSLADRGEARLLATVCCTSSPWGAPCLDALNTWFGRPEIPVGTLRATGFLTDPGPYQEQIARRFPHRLTTGADAADAVDLYRRVLAAQPDQSVAVIAVGPLPNLRGLLASPGDAHSPLDGTALVARKVLRLACMGGAYPASAAGRDGEWNFAMDGPAARAVAERWPTPVLYSGYEIGGGLMTGRRLALDTPEHGPLAIAYGLYIGYGRDRESWDLTAALAGVRGGADLWPISAPGSCQVDDKGHNSFVPDAKGRHSYLVRREPAQPIEDALEELLASAKHGPLSLDHDIALFARDGYGLTSASDGEAARAFDRKPDTVWYAAGGESWLRYDLADGRAAEVVAYTVTVPDEQPRSWALEASADGGANWVRLDTHTAEPLRAAGGPRTFRLT
ncbi:MAG: nucleoside hydrolase, partial [Armatimonadetes bacterium]|nr:nucleoside hydrolase [Armatimonadota bacterium]